MWNISLVFQGYQCLWNRRQKYATSRIKLYSYNENIIYWVPKYKITLDLLDFFSNKISETNYKNI